MTAPNLSIAWAALLLDTLERAGVRDVVISPGSRSTPITWAAVKNPRLRTWTVVDERSAGFFALGQAKASGRPSLLVCTSGSAPAHYFPAVIEASQSFTPLLVLSADRPLELQECGAPQTIDQTRLFGAHARAFFELGLPDESDAALRALARAAVAAVERAHDGPVHLNARFRKPLEPALPSPADEALARRIASLPAPARVFAPASVPAPEAIAAAAEAIARAKRGLVIAGPAPLQARAAAEPVLRLAEAAGFPLLVETSSQLRAGAPRAGRIDHPEAILRAASFRRGHRPDLIVQIGATPTSDGYARLVDESACERIVVSPHGWPDPSSSASMIVRAQPGAFASGVLACLRPRGPDSWAESFARAEAIARRAIDAELASPPFWDGHVARAVTAGAGEGSLLMVGNSLPIRDVDTWGGPVGAGVLSQRGANGIDGLISGAAGAASVTGRPVTLLLGDLSFLHDLHGLAAAREIGAPLAIVVVQNHGGRIFEQLPIAEAAGTAEWMGFWTTPIEADLKHAAALFGHRHVRVGSEGALAGALAEAHRREEVTVIEAEVPPHEGGERSRRLRDRLEKELDHA